MVAVAGPYANIPFARQLLDKAGVHMEVMKKKDFKVREVENYSLLNRIIHART